VRAKRSLSSTWEERARERRVPAASMPDASDLGPYTRGVSSPSPSSHGRRRGMRI
jgi:hypothetical protein